MDLNVPVCQAAPELIERRWGNVDEQGGDARVGAQLSGALHIHTQHTQPAYFVALSGAPPSTYGSTVTHRKLAVNMCEVPVLHSYALGHTDSCEQPNA